jgi:glyceraldehyde-3-phosphate dehydrogenase/erythrose-4-phosphate dehydrogenase
MHAVHTCTRQPPFCAGLAVRVPLLNSSITDCVFEVKRETSVEEVNSLVKVGVKSCPRLVHQGP